MESTRIQETETAMDSKTTSKETAMEQKMKSLWWFMSYLADKYPNEKLWNAFTKCVWDYEDAVRNLVGTYAEIQRDCDNDLANMAIGFNPNSLSLSSRAERIAELRQELNRNADQFKLLARIAGISEQDDDDFWTLVQSTLKNGGK